MASKLKGKSLARIAKQHIATQRNNKQERVNVQKEIFNEVAKNKLQKKTKEQKVAADKAIRNETQPFDRVKTNSGKGFNEVNAETDGQDKAVNISSREGQAYKRQPQGTPQQEILYNGDTQAWEPLTGHSGVESSFAVATDKYDPNTKDLTLTFRGRSKEYTYPLDSDDDYLQFDYSPSKGWWVKGDRNQDITRTPNRLWGEALQKSLSEIQK